MDSHPSANPVVNLQPEVASDDLGRLIAAIDEMSRVIAFSSAHQNTRGALRKAHIEEMFMACKEVIVAGEPIRRELRDEAR